MLAGSTFFDCIRGKGLDLESPMAQEVLQWRPIEDCITGDMEQVTDVDSLVEVSKFYMTGIWEMNIVGWFKEIIHVTNFAGCW